jgi:predicted HTH domain antitoxin
MKIEIPDEVLPHLSRSEEELKVDFAIFLYKSDILSLGKAAELLNISKLEF